jgi:hypothetical protein
MEEPDFSTVAFNLMDLDPGMKIHIYTEFRTHALIQISQKDALVGFRSVRMVI